jgi:hypothetical protein
MEQRVNVNSESRFGLDRNKNDCERYQNDGTLVQSPGGELDSRSQNPCEDEGIYDHTYKTKVTIELASSPYENPYRRSVSASSEKYLSLSG